MFKKDGRIYLSGKASCEILGISRQLFHYHLMRLEEECMVEQDYPWLLYRPKRILPDRNTKVNLYSLTTVMFIASHVNTDDAQSFLLAVLSVFDYCFRGQNRILVYTKRDLFAELNRRRDLCCLQMK